MVLPLWLLGVLLVGGSTLMSVAGLYVVRRRVSAQTLREHHDVAGFILAIVGVIYAVVLAFVVLVVWERYGEADIVAAREANAVVDIYRLAPGFSSPVKAKICADARLYAHSVVEKEWPAMAVSQASDDTSHSLDQLWGTSIKTKVRNASEAAIFGQVLDRLTDVSDNRRLRLLASRTGVPAPMWMVLVVGGIATVLFTYYFGLEKFSVQAGMTALLTILISLVLFLISALNYPFTGDLGVQPEAMQTALERFDTIDQHEAGQP